MKLIIYGNKFIGKIKYDDGTIKEIKLNSDPFLECYNSSIYLFKTMYELYLLEGILSVQEACRRALLHIGGYPSCQIDGILIPKKENSQWSKIIIEPKKIEEIKKERKHIDIIDVTERAVFYCENDFDIIRAVLLHFLSIEGKRIRRCKNCGKYFIPINRNDDFFCDREIDGKTCKEINKEKIKKKYSSNTIIKKKNSISNIYRDYYPKYYEEFLKCFKGKMKEFKDKKINETEILDWLENNRAVKVEKRGGCFNG